MKCHNENMAIKNMYFSESITANANVTRPFKIGLADNEVILIHALHVYVRTATFAVDVTFTLQWALMALDHNGDDDYPMTAFDSLDGGGTIDKDNEVLDHGDFGRTTVAFGPVFKSEPVIHYYKPRIVIPVSPSILLCNNAGATTNIDMGFSLHYQKAKCSREEILRALKKYPGRAHDRVSNEPLHGGEDEAGGP